MVLYACWKEIRKEETENQKDIPWNGTNIIGMFFISPEYLDL